jgi:hypothetical protein
MLLILNKESKQEESYPHVNKKKSSKRKSTTTTTL